MKMNKLYHIFAEFLLYNICVYNNNNTASYNCILRKTKCSGYKASISSTLACICTNIVRHGPKNIYPGDLALDSSNFREARASAISVLVGGRRPGRSIARPAVDPRQRDRLTVPLSSSRSVISESR